jgi:eukaryotic-like serine/threonine-protein kinase
MPENEGRPAHRSRVGFPLVLKIFLVTASMIALVVAAAIAITIRRSEDVALRTANESIGSSLALFRALERDRLARLEIGAASLANDPSFLRYLQDAEREPAVEEAPAAPESSPVPVPQPQIDYVSIHDALVDRRELLGSDLIVVTDSEGLLLGRSDRVPTAAVREDLYERIPRLKSMIDEGAGEVRSGVVVLDETLFHASIAPMEVGAGNVVQAYIINAYRIDEAFANRISETTRSSVTFLPSSAGEAPRSLDAPNAAAIRAMPQVARSIAGGKPLPVFSTKIDGSRFVIASEPMVSGSGVAGLVVFARDLDRVLAPYREIQRTLLFAGLAALLLSFPISWLLAKRLTKPIEQLAEAAERIAGGDYGAQPSIERRDEVGVLGRSFRQMVTALQDKAELEAMYEELSRNQKPVAAPVRKEEATVLVTDLRGIPSDLGDGDASSVVSLMSRAMLVQEAEVRRQEGEVREILGHRLVSVFHGDRSVIHAIRAARAIREELALQMKTDVPLTLGAGIATGDVISGEVQLETARGMAFVGNAPMLALLFAWDAPSGVVFLSSESAQQAGSDILAGATREEVKLRWLAAPLSAYALPLVSLSTAVINTGPRGAAATMRIGTGTLPVTGELEPGTTFAQRYEIEQVIGRGGMGVVFRAKDTQLDEVVALKTLTGDAMQRSSEELERFKREIRIARKITHRNVLRTYDFGESEGISFISMEYVRGYTLGELIQKPQSPRVALSVVRQICRGLEAAHAEGIVHRDIKPQNVLIDQRGEVKLMDFGIARMSGGADAMTAAGVIIGSPHYMSPEQVRGEALDAQSDVYSMGVMMYEIFCGRRPFESSALTALLGAHLTEVPPPPIEIAPSIPFAMSGIIMRCLEKEKSKRFANAGELLEALDRVELSSAA